MKQDMPRADLNNTTVANIKMYSLKEQE